jgi:Fur family ferric uptake transcriptional regulator
MRPEMQILRQHLVVNGLKLTRQRTTIAERFLAAEGHLSAEELYHVLAGEGQRVGLATVYRTLKMLVDAGLAQERHFPDGAARYETVFGEPQHDHLVCVKCGRIMEIENPLIEPLYQLAFERHEFVASGHRLVVTGVCKECQAAG